MCIRDSWGMDRFRVIALDNLLSDLKFTDKLSDDDYAAALAMLLKKLKILLKGAIKHRNQALIEECQNKLQRWQPGFINYDDGELC